MYNFIKTISEGRTPKTLSQPALPYARDALGRSISKTSLDYHYGQLYKGYVDRFNNGDGDVDFNEAGAFLHDLYFSQFQSPASSNQPTGKAKDLIEEHFKSWDNFKKAFEKTAMSIQGSGWVYLAKNGEIKTIKNHDIKKDIALLVDWWEHAYNIDFRADKKKYLEGQWRIINWNIVNSRL